MPSKPQICSPSLNSALQASNMPSAVLISHLRPEICPLRTYGNSPLCSTGHRPFGAAALLSLHFFTGSLPAGHRVPLTMCDPWMTCLLYCPCGLPLPTLSTSPRLVIKCFFHTSPSISSLIGQFLVACTRLYNPLCPSVRWSVGRSRFTFFDFISSPFSNKPSFSFKEAVEFWFFLAFPSAENTVSLPK